MRRIACRMQLENMLHMPEILISDLMVQVPLNAEGLSFKKKFFYQLTGSYSSQLERWINIGRARPAKLISSSLVKLRLSCHILLNAV